MIQGKIAQLPIQSQAENGVGISDVVDRGLDFIIYLTDGREYKIKKPYSTKSNMRSIGGGGDVTYVRPTPTENALGGAPAGTIFTGTVQEALDKLLYQPYTPSANVRTAIVKVTEDYEMAAGDTILLCDCSAGEIQILLPKLDDGLTTFMTTIKKIDGSSNKVVLVNPLGGIDGYEMNEIMFKNTALTLVSLDNEFYIV